MRPVSVLHAIVLTSALLPATGASAAEISGRITDAVTGAPIAGVTVSAIESGPGDVFMSAPSSEDGTYTIFGLDDDVLYQVSVATAPRHASAMDMHEMLTRPGADIDFSLQPLVALEGKVVDENGNAAANAMVYALAAFNTLYDRAVEADANGQFTFNTLSPESPVTFVAASAGYVSEPLTVEIATLAKPLELVLIPAATVSGTLVDAAGRPAADVKILAHYEDMSSMFGIATTTDAQGRFTFTGLFPGDYEITMQSGEPDIETGPFDSLTDMASPEKMLEFFETEFADVSFTPEMRESFVNEMRTSMEQMFGEDVMNRPEIPYRAGMFVFDELSLDNVRVGAGETRTLSLVVPTIPTGDYSISGRVTYTDGAPASGVNVDVYGPEDAADPLFEDADTDSEGYFEITGLAEGVYDVDVNDYSMNYFLEGQSITVAAGATDVDFVLPRPATLQGRVVEAATGAAISNYRIGWQVGLPTGRTLWGTEVARPGGASTRDFAPTMVRITDADGRFELQNVQPGPVTLFVEADGFSMAAHALEAVGDGETLSDIEIPLAPPANFEVHVVDAAGNPVPSADIFYSYVRPDAEVLQTSNLRTDATGRLVLSTLPPNADTLWADHPDFAPGAAQISGNATGATIILQPGGILEGAFTNPEGTPLPYASGHAVLASPDGMDIENYSRVFDTDGAGRYRLDDLPAGFYLLNLYSSDDRCSVSETAEVLAGHTTTFDVQCQSSNLQNVDVGGEAQIR